jgi:hypothetical protein
MRQNTPVSSPVVCDSVRIFSESPVTVPEKAQWEYVTVEEHRFQPPCECGASLWHHKVTIALREVVMQRRLDPGPPARHKLQPGDLFISPCNGYLVHLFGKSYRKSDRAYFHSMQIDVQPGKI